MQEYLRKLYMKPDHHKKRFALLASSTITLFIFGIWSVATFGINDGIIANNESASTASAQVANEVSPFQSLHMSLASSFEAILASFSDLKNSLKIYGQ